MSPANLCRVTNDFRCVRLVSLRKSRIASTIVPRDPGGPFMVAQEGYDPQDVKMTPDTFLLGRSGRWLSTADFFRMSVADRRREYVFGTAAEVATLLRELPPQPVIFRPDDLPEAARPSETDDMKTALEAARQSPPGPDPGQTTV
ncbi:MAG TPA: hypothetical protein PKM43_16970 [Verrucomicrobiota bacterium]|nr:hypothetical protein [Verrucomicrobiota bacterium]HRZ37044.1 hypothetical protein [Candidatus Paceibacterota bacterium]HRZ54610.1 hypothetical protein [Candidatus Paceibacterota bacterium]